MSGAFDLKDINRRMDGAVEALRKELNGLRTGRASASLLEPVTVEAYGSRMPLNQVASVSVPEPRMLVVQVWDAGMAKAVEKSIRDAGLGLNPASEGTSIRVPIPDLSEERRRELSKAAGKYAESARVAIRNVRRDGMDLLKRQQKDSSITEDEQAKFSKQIQDATDTHIKLVDEAFSAKEKEIMQV